MYRIYCAEKTGINKKFRFKLRYKAHIGIGFYGPSLRISDITAYLRWKEKIRSEIRQLAALKISGL